MVSDEQIREALRQAQEQWRQWTGTTPPLPVWVDQMFEQPDTHDVWRALNEEG